MTDTGFTPNWKMIQEKMNDCADRYFDKGTELSDAEKKNLREQIFTLLIKYRINNLSFNLSKGLVAFSADEHTEENTAEASSDGTDTEESDDVPSAGDTGGTSYGSYRSSEFLFDAITDFFDKNFENYDPEKYEQFSQYATTCIKCRRVDVIQYELEHIYGKSEKKSADTVDKAVSENSAEADRKDNISEACNPIAESPRKKQSKRKTEKNSLLVSIDETGLEIPEADTTHQRLVWSDSLLILASQVLQMPGFVENARNQGIPVYFRMFYTDIASKSIREEADRPYHATEIWNAMDIDFLDFIFERNVKCLSDLNNNILRKRGDLYLEDDLSRLAETEKREKQLVTNYAYKAYLHRIKNIAISTESVRKQRISYLSTFATKLIE